MGMRVVVPPIAWAERGVFREWHREDGDWVNTGARLCSLQMGTQLHEITALDSGFLRLGSRKTRSGAAVHRGELLGLVIAPGERAEGFAKGIPELPNRLAREVEFHPQWSAVARTTRPERRRISPRARRAASEAGIRWENLHGSGRDGRIVAHDVEAAARLRPASVAPAESQLLSASFTRAIEKNQSTAVERDVNQLLLRSAEVLQRRSSKHEHLGLGFVKGTKLRFATLDLDQTLTLVSIESARANARHQVPDAASWLLVDAATAGLETLQMPLRPGHKAMLLVGVDRDALRATLVADQRALNLSELLEILQAIRGDV